MGYTEYLNTSIHADTVDRGGWPIVPADLKCQMPAGCRLDVDRDLPQTRRPILPMLWTMHEARLTRTEACLLSGIWHSGIYSNNGCLTPT
jgi:hypothetical protein